MKNIGSKCVSWGIAIIIISLLSTNSYTPLYAGGFLVVSGIIALAIEKTKPRR